ncbi:MAG TPA: sugar ABC transporter substrate-binding protein [Feifaniaceae bacterium]|nr:sugar ABC transporter substrate-binding protein [Feifaniaceae bacterium]
MKKGVLIRIAVLLICSMALTPLLISCVAAPAAEQPAAPESPAAPAPAPESSAPAERAVSFALWDENQYPVYEEICKKFTAETGISVDLQLTPWDQYWTKLDAAATAGNAADVFWMNVYMSKYYDAGVIEPIESYFTADGLNKDDYIKAMADLYSIDGKLVCMPKGLDVVVVAYNKAIFDKYGVAYPQEGWTWADMEKTGAALRDAIKAAGGEEYPLVMELDSQPSYLQFWIQDGVVPYGPDFTKTNFSDPAATKAFDDVMSLMDQGIMPSFTVLSDTKGTDLFISSRAAMVYVGSWKSVVLDGCSIASDIGLVTMPTRSVSNVCTLGGISFAINSSAADKDAAWQLVKYLGGEESNKMQAEGRIDIPALKSAQQYYAPAFQNIDPTAFVTQSGISTVYPFHARMFDWNNLQNDIVAQIWSKAVTPADGLKELAAEADAIIGG